jgi:rhamnogalacturonan endolyase
MARKGFSHIYMATHFTEEPAIGLVRFIVRIPNGLLPNGPTPSEIRNTDSTVESGDIFGFSGTNANVALRGQTRSKHYSNQRLKDWSYTGATGTNVAAWMVRSNHEGDCGGPFWRCLINQCGDQQELYEIVNYGEAQTEAFRTNILNGPYTLVFTNGGAPPALDTSWVANMGLVGYVGSSGRGTVTCGGISGRDTSYTYTVGFANAAAQYWTDAAASNGAFTMTGMLSGTYTMSIHKNELVVYTTSVAVTAGGLVTLNPITITNDPSATVPVWRIGNWDGAPNEFLNGDKVTTMHPSDVRIATWNPGPYVVGTSSPATGIPCYQWGDVNSNQVINFTATAVQAAAANTIRIGITNSYSGARPKITVNSWTSSNPAAPSYAKTRSLTVGTYRGFNTTYTYTVPAGTLVSGTANTITIFPISGSTGTGFLSPGYSLDCLDIYQGTARTLAVPNAPSFTATAGNGQVSLSWPASSGAAGYNIQRATISGGPYTAIASGTATTYTDTGRANGTTYYYVVSGSNTSGTGVNSAEASATPVPPPVAPTGLIATPGDAQVALNWTAPANATRYIVSRSLTSGTGYLALSSSAVGTTYTDAGLTNGTPYYYVVAAANVSGTSANSAEVSAKPAQTFGQWRVAAFPGQTDPLVIGPNADPDRDGGSNLLEYFLASNPNTADTLGLVTASRDESGNVVLTFRMSKNLSGITYAVQQSPDLRTWTAIAAAPVVISEQSGYYVMRATASLAENGKLFLRLFITSQ